MLLLPASLAHSAGPAFPAPVVQCVIEEATEVPVGGDSLSVQGPVLQAVDCPSGLHQGVCSRACMGALPQDSSSSVPGRLAGPHLFGGGGQKERPGSALGLSLPKRGEVRSRTLADCKLPRYDHRYSGPPGFFRPLLWQVVLGHLALLERLVPHSRLRMRSLQWHLKTHWSPKSDPPSLLGGERGFVLVDGEGPSSQGGSIRDTSSRSTPVLRRVSVGVGLTPPRSSSVRGVVGAGEVAAHQPSRNEGIVSGIAVILGVGRQSPCDRDVRQLDSGGLRQQAGRDGLPFPLLLGQPASKVVRESRRPPRCEVSTRAIQCSGRSPQPSGSGYWDRVVSPPAGGETCFVVGARRRSICSRRVSM